MLNSCPYSYSRSTPTFGSGTTRSGPALGQPVRHSLREGIYTFRSSGFVRKAAVEVQNLLTALCESRLRPQSE
ncbi:hypothetical protein ACRALDRAFT_2021526 [Sodiomyces alcalophilus JCM 7366]|uniref:uncharacterized protein n=1 Tax=Sodiomyces alcalophilus JCM 7366 TaxID=591952 RepID=UPI0039B3E549